MKNDNLKVSYLLRDHSIFFKDYEFSEKNANFVLKKFIEKKGDKFYYNNPLAINEVKKEVNNSSMNEKNISLIKNTSLNNVSDNENMYNNNEIDYGSIVSDHNLIINEVK